MDDDVALFNDIRFHLLKLIQVTDDNDEKRYRQGLVRRIDKKLAKRETWKPSKAMIELAWEDERAPRQDDETVDMEVKLHGR